MSTTTLLARWRCATPSPTDSYLTKPPRPIRRRPRRRRRRNRRKARQTRVEQRMRRRRQPGRTCSNAEQQQQPGPATARPQMGNSRPRPHGSRNSGSRRIIAFRLRELLDGARARQRLRRTRRY